jgi:hypothetical protein
MLRAIKILSQNVIKTECVEKNEPAGKSYLFVSQCRENITQSKTRFPGLNKLIHQVRQFLQLSFQMLDRFKVMRIIFVSEKHEPGFAEFPAGSAEFGGVATVSEPDRANDLVGEIHCRIQFRIRLRVGWVMMIERHIHQWLG